MLVATERSSRGGRLVGVRSDGARQYELTQLSDEQTIIDRSPTISPDGSTVVFVSNRGLSDIAATRLWRVPIAGGQPELLSRSEGVQRDPRFSPDGSWLYFCSNQEGSFDLYRAPFGATGLGKATRIIDSPEQILSPAISPDGNELVYMAVSEQGESQLWRAASDGSGTPVALTDGPMDMTPAWASDNTIAFASRAPNRDDADIYVVSADGGQPKALLSMPLTDETGPQFSYDGRYLFAIGMYRGSDGKPLLGSVIYLDRKETPLKYRALHDSAAVESRIGLALIAEYVPSTRLHANEEYEAALKRVIMQEWLRSKSGSREGQGEGKREGHSDSDESSD